MKETRYRVVQFKDGAYQVQYAVYNPLTGLWGQEQWLRNSDRQIWRVFAKIDAERLIDREKAIEEGARNWNVIKEYGEWR